MVGQNTFFNVFKRYTAKVPVTLYAHAIYTHARILNFLNECQATCTFLRLFVVVIVVVQFRTRRYLLCEAKCSVTKSSPILSKKWIAHGAIFIQASFTTSHENILPLYLEATVVCCC